MSHSNPVGNKNSSSNKASRILDKKAEESPLRGEELLNYIESHKSQGEDNGDNICIGAGYGDHSEEGQMVCRLDLFSTELINAKKAQHNETHTEKARLQILETYNLEKLKQIADKGCVSGVATFHLQILENERFYDENEKEIKLYLEDQFGSGYLENSAERTGGPSSHWKHRAVWKFIEMIASEELEKEAYNQKK